jgi:hypothetical protein
MRRDDGRVTTPHTTHPGAGEDALVDGAEHELRGRLAAVAVDVTRARRVGGRHARGRHALRRRRHRPP